MPRPKGLYKTVLDWEKVGELAKFQCTQQEIASFFDTSVDTLTRQSPENTGLTFAAFIDEKRKSGLAKLRMKQLQVAMGGNVTMLIFLGKQYLGQSDKTESIVQSDNVNQELYPAMTKEQARKIVEEQRQKQQEEEAKNVIKENLSP